MSTSTIAAHVHPGEEQSLNGNVTRSGDKKRIMRILLAGAGGMIGSALAPYLAAQGHEIIRLVRRAPGAGEVRWDPDARTIDAAGLEGFDGVVHLASLPHARWTSDFKQRMRDNRLRTNHLLAETLAGCARKPQVLVCASGQGVYAPSGDQVLTEESPVGMEYLAEVQRAGEAATADRAEEAARHRLPVPLSGAGGRAAPRAWGCSVRSVAASNPAAATVARIFAPAYLGEPQCASGGP